MSENDKFSAFLKKFMCKKCNNIDYSSILNSGANAYSGPPKEVYKNGYICKTCLKIDNRDSIIDKILS